GEQVAADDPLEPGHACAQVPADGGQGHVDHGGVQGGHARPEDGGHQHPAPLRGAEAHGLRRAVAHRRILLQPSAVYGGQLPENESAAAMRDRQAMIRWGMFMDSAPTSRSPRPKAATNRRSSSDPSTTANSSVAVARPRNWILVSYWSDQK